MPYNRVHIAGGRDCRVAGLEAREMFRGRDADYTGRSNCFLLERDYDQAALERNLAGFHEDRYDVAVEIITEVEYYWRRGG